jgi:hypothetical protein
MPPAAEAELRRHRVIDVTGEIDEPAATWIARRHRHGVADAVLVGATQ